MSTVYDEGGNVFLAVPVKGRNGGRGGAEMRESEQTGGAAMVPGDKPTLA